MAHLNILCTVTMNFCYETVTMNSSYETELNHEFL